MKLLFLLTFFSAVGALNVYTYNCWQPGLLNWNVDDNTNACTMNVDPTGGRISAVAMPDFVFDLCSGVYNDDYQQCYEQHSADAFMFNSTTQHSTNFWPSPNERYLCVRADPVKQGVSVDVDVTFDSNCNNDWNDDVDCFYGCMGWPWYSGGAAILVLLVCCGVWFGVRAHRRRDFAAYRVPLNGGSNAAVIHTYDGTRTSVMVGQPAYQQPSYGGYQQQPYAYGAPVAGQPVAGQPVQAGYTPGYAPPPAVAPRTQNISDKLGREGW